MSLTAITAIAQLGLEAIDKIFPDPEAKSRQILALQELESKGDIAELNAHVQLMLGQLNVNKEEAKSASLFVAGWRPAVGWVSATGLAIAFIPKAIAITVMWTIQSYLMLDSSVDWATFVLPPFPDLGMTDLFGILGAMLGIGTMRSFDKTKNNSTERIS